MSGNKSIPIHEAKSGQVPYRDVVDGLSKLIDAVQSIYDLVGLETLEGEELQNALEHPYISAGIL